MDDLLRRDVRDQHPGHPQALSLNPLSRLRLQVACALCLGLSLVVGACGGNDDPGPGEEPGLPEPSLSARLAVAGPITNLDPIHVDSRSERIISRQIFEPVSSRLDPPFNQLGRRRGPARPESSLAGDTLWEFQVRPGVLFHDGTPLSVDAVTANATRWLASGLAAEILPELIVADNPRPGVVRFQLSEAVPDFPARLSDPRLGLVSPVAIEENGIDPITEGLSGTGAFELRELSEGRALLAGSAVWWGGEVGLGPGVQRLEFVADPDPGGRLELLRQGEVEIADELMDEGGEPLAVADPLLTTISELGVTIGLSRSVRGFDSVLPDQPLSELWLTTLR